MAGAWEKILIVTAVAVTAVICIYGMYTLIGGSEEKQDVYVTAYEGSEDKAASFFTEFEEYAKAKVIIYGVSDPQIYLLNEGADVIISTDGTMSGASVKQITLTISDDTPVYVYYKEGTQGMAGAFINWLNGQ
jgi:hypothetical protein